MIIELVIIFQIVSGNQIAITSQKFGTFETIAGCERIKTNMIPIFKKDVADLYEISGSCVLTQENIF